MWPDYRVLVHGIFIMRRNDHDGLGERLANGGGRGIE